MTPSLNLNRVINGTQTGLPSGVTVELHLPARQREPSRGRSFVFADDRWLERITHPDSAPSSNRPIEDEWVFCVRNALVTSDHTVYAEDGTLLESRAGWSLGPGSNTHVTSLPLPVSTLAAQVALSGGNQGSVSERWLSQVMPGAVRLRQLFGAVPVIVPPTKMSHEERWLTAGIPPEMRVVLPQAEQRGAISAVRVHELLITNQIVLSRGISADRFDHVQKQFENISLVPGTSEHIFITRNPEQRRKRRGLSNSQHIQEIAAGLGFTVVKADELSLHEMIALVGGAKVIVGEVGSDLHPTIFAPPGRTVVELAPRSRDSRKGQLQLIGAYRGHKVGTIPCEGDRQTWTANPMIVEAALGQLLRSVS